MYIYSQLDLPIRIINKIDKENKRIRKKRKQMDEDAESNQFTDDEMQDDILENEELECNDSSFIDEIQDEENELINKQNDIENTSDKGFLDNHDILILKTMIDYKFSSPIIVSPQPIIDSAFELINENITDSISLMTDQITQILQLITQTEHKIQENKKLAKQTLEKMQKFKNSMNNEHQNFKYMFDIPLFHRIIYKIQDIFFLIWPLLYRLFKFLIIDRFN